MTPDRPQRTSVCVLVLLIVAVHSLVRVLRRPEGPSGGLSLPFHDHSPDGNGRVTRYCPSASATCRLPWHGSALGLNRFVSAAEIWQGNAFAGAANPLLPSTAATAEWWGSGGDASTCARTCRNGPCRKLLSLVSPERSRLSALTNFVDTPPPRRSWDRRGASLPFA